MQPSRCHSFKFRAGKNCLRTAHRVKSKVHTESNVFSPNIPFHLPGFHRDHVSINSGYHRQHCPQVAVTARARAVTWSPWQAPSHLEPTVFSNGTMSNNIHIWHMTNINRHIPDMWKQDMSLLSYTRHISINCWYILYTRDMNNWVISSRYPRQMTSTKFPSVNWGVLNLEEFRTHAKFV